MEKDVKLKPKLIHSVLVNSLQRTSFKHIGIKPDKKKWSLVSCTIGLSIKPHTEEVVIDKQWLHNKKAWMISLMEEDGKDLKIKLISGDTRKLIWNHTTHGFSNIELRRVISLLGRDNF